MIKKMFPNTQVQHIEDSDRRNYRVSFDKIETQLGFTAPGRSKTACASFARRFEDKEITDYTDTRYYNRSSSRSLAARHAKPARRTLDGRLRQCSKSADGDSRAQQAEWPHRDNLSDRHGGRLRQSRLASR